MNTLRVRTSYATIARSRAVVTFALFMVCLTPMTIGFLGARAAAANHTLRVLFGISASVPAVGILVAAASLVVVVWRRRKVVLELGHHLHITRTGVRLEMSQISRVQTWTRDFGKGGVYSYLALVPAHIDARMGNRPGPDTASGAPRELDAYVAEFPRGVEPNVFEVVELIRAENPDVVVEKLGNIRC
ncbi:hypothetical protein [Corynebacterium sp.]|uniref:hypothetical protein n=1 Tax=Corynebacterium sp. TaxID=1720 RepID=UPI0026DB42EB|nr:hypothetical protein [Corynebacterium sp.]MDO5076070.1 hypothetical protein [Corynebacterium sp.]